MKMPYDNGSRDGNDAVIIQWMLRIVRYLQKQDRKERIFSYRLRGHANILMFRFLTPNLWDNIFLKVLGIKY